MSDLEQLRLQWTQLYSKTLPSLARAKDSAQARWPVSLDHCFARIILDNTVGGVDGRTLVQWDTVIKKPAVKNMSEEQLEEAIALGEMVKSGEVDLVDLDKRSLQARGKNEKKYAKSTENKKRPQSDGENEQRSPVKKQKTQATLPFAVSQRQGPKQLPSEPEANVKAVKHEENASSDFQATLQRIFSHKSLTPYRKRLYATLLTVPTGQYTTYQAMADFLNSSARAVGNGMRNNPFAPDVPCHRVLASDRSLGGFKGDWGKDGRYAAHKVQLLRDEGVKFDSNGKVRGPIFRAFQKFDETHAVEAG